METQTLAGKVQEVQTALKRYHRPDELAQHTALRWSAVQELSERGIGSVAAIRQVLDQALERLSTRDGGGAELLRRHYVLNRSIETLAQEHAFDPSTLHRQRQRLVQELGVILEDLNREATRRIRSERFRPHQPVVGFSALAADLADRLHDPDGPLVLVLEGMGGLGKTTLARLVAQRCATDETFSDVLWVSAKQTDFDVWGGRRRAADATACNAEELLVALARELQLAIPADRALLEAEVRAHCKRSRYLVVIDNLETVTDMAAVAPLVELVVGPSRVLLTTRDRAPEALPATLPRHYVALSELDAPTSYTLLREAAAFTGAAMLAQASDAELAHIYAVTGGSPLALWLVAGQASDMPWATFIHDLAEYCPRGSVGYELYAYLYQRSWEQLSQAARTVLFAMHRCEGGAEYELLLLLTQLDRATFRAAVSELRRRMLLNFDGQYTIHRLTYTFLRVVIAGWWE